MAEYKYEVIRAGNIVRYKLWKNDEVITTTPVTLSDLGFFGTATSDNGSERAIGKQLKLAHKLAKLAIANMRKYCDDG